MQALARTVASPASVEEVQDIVNLSHNNKTSIMTCNDHYLPARGQDSKAVLLSISRLSRTNGLLLKGGGSLQGKMLGCSEYHLPLWGEYYKILRRTKVAFDPDNLMHPDVLPLTDDYV